ncbi:MAG TPA: hypothetical protein PK926_11000 [Spirochaetota bacterium]|nr:hypothetical protein [Spirochaetota bacterium]HPI88423.1 hypothetical protein [Spirochaetota bacterium]HPR49892.1 hypothetical protein [Spirochaetota bacterium]
MSEEIRSFLLMLKAIAIYLSLGALVAFIFYNLKRRDLFAGYIGGLVVGVIGALIGGFILDKLFYDISVKILEFLSRGAGVNIIAGFIGAYAALFIMNKLNHNKERKKY